MICLDVFGKIYPIRKPHIPNEGYLSYLTLVLSTHLCVMSRAHRLECLIQFHRAYLEQKVNDYDSTAHILSHHLFELNMSMDRLVSSLWVESTSPMNWIDNDSIQVHRLKCDLGSPLIWEPSITYSFEAGSQLFSLPLNRRNLSCVQDHWPNPISFLVWMRKGF